MHCAVHCIRTLFSPQSTHNVLIKDCQSVSGLVNAYAHMSEKNVNAFPNAYASVNAPALLSYDLRVCHDDISGVRLVWCILINKNIEYGSEC